MGIIPANPGSLPDVGRFSTGHRVRRQTSIEPTMSQHACKWRQRLDLTLVAVRISESGNGYI